MLPFVVVGGFNIALMLLLMVTMPSIGRYGKCACVILDMTFAANVSMKAIVVLLLPLLYVWIP